MAQSCKVGTYIFRINPSDDRQLQVRSIGGSRFAYYWTAPNGYHILDLMPRGDEMVIYTDRYNYVRKRSGSITPEY